MGQLHQCPGERVKTHGRLHRRRVAAHCLLRGPRPRGRHARRHHRRCGHLAGLPDRRLRAVGQGEQQPADRHLGRGRRSRGQPIATIFYGAAVRPGTYDAAINHYSVLSTIQEIYGPPKTGQAASTSPIAGIWSPDRGRVGSQRRSGPNSPLHHRAVGIVLRSTRRNPIPSSMAFLVCSLTFERPRRRGVARAGSLSISAFRTSSTGVPGGEWA